MKNKIENQGFTLVELLAILVLLGMLAGMVIIKISDTLQKANDVYYKEQENFLVLAAKDYFSDYRSRLPKEIGEKKEVSLKTLEEEDYVTDEILDVQSHPCNPEKSKVIVTYFSEKKYTYQAVLVCEDAHYETSEK